MAEEERSHWVPLESNPAVLSSFAGKLGVEGVGTQVDFCDVYGLDDELLAMVPQPVHAVLLLYPINDETEALRRAQAAAAAAAPTDGPSQQQQAYFMRQTIGNACGTIGLLHACLNAARAGRVALRPGSFLAEFLAATDGLDPAARGAYLERPPPGAPSMAAAHADAAAEGQTAPPAADADVALHFVAFVRAGGALVELDGRRAAPVAHGPTSEGSLLRDVARVVRDEYVSRAGGSLNFSLIAMAGAE